MIHALIEELINENDNQVQCSSHEPFNAILDCKIAADHAGEGRVLRCVAGGEKPGMRSESTTGSEGYSKDQSLDRIRRIVGTLRVL